MLVARLLVLAATLAGAAACTGSSGNTATLRTDPSATPTIPIVATKCCVPPSEPNLHISVTPTAGPPGTVVHIVVTGCGEADATDRPTVSFNNDAENFSARNERDTVRLITTEKAESTYTIVRRDHTGGVGMFFVQCGQSLQQTRFDVTG